MYNLLISLGIAAVLFAIGMGVGGSAVAGIVPAVLGAGVAYFFLARRSFKQLEVAAQQAMVHLQTVQQDPSGIDRAKAVLETARPVGKWQFLIGAQVEGQLGQLEYMRCNLTQSKDLSVAKAHLVKAWKRDWMSQAVLACVLHKDKQPKEAMERLDGAKWSGSNQPIYWALYAWIAKASGDEDRTLRVLEEGLKSNERHAGLLAFRDAAANGKALPIEAFSPQWFQFFPMHIQKLPYSKQMELMGANAPPMNRQQRRQMKKGGGQAAPKKGRYQPPHPRR